MSRFKFDSSYFLIKHLLDYLRNKLFTKSNNAKSQLVTIFYTTHNRGQELFMQEWQQLPNNVQRKYYAFLAIFNISSQGVAFN